MKFKLKLPTQEDSSRRSLFKALTWRVTATMDTFIISWLITGKLSWATAIAGVEILTKMFLYYFHERMWNRTDWGKKE
jgi:uncharacterized membrane protein